MSRSKSFDSCYRSRRIERLRHRLAAKRETTHPERFRHHLQEDRRPRCIIIDRRDRPGYPDRRPATNRHRAKSTEPFDVSLLRGRSTRESLDPLIALKAACPGERRYNEKRSRETNVKTEIARMGISYRQLRLACDVTFNYKILIPTGTCNVTCRVTQGFDL